MHSPEEESEEDEPIDRLRPDLFARSGCIIEPSTPSLLCPGSLWTATDGIIARMVFRSGMGRSVAGDLYLRDNPSKAVYFDAELVHVEKVDKFMHVGLPQPTNTSKAQLHLAVTLENGQKMIIFITLSDRAPITRRHSSSTPASDAQAPARGRLARRYSTALTGISDPLPAITPRDEAEESVYPSIFPLPTSSIGSRRKKTSRSANVDQPIPTTAGKPFPAVPMVDSEPYTGPMMHATLIGYYEDPSQATSTPFQLKYSGDGSTAGYNQYSKHTSCTFSIL